ncbi:hypothetical protein [Candidatus Carsonella ruddii]|uniref:Putative ribosomal protein L21 n=1 Tax=Candidatus Carsonella ruddii PC isolate NHV TaxID=1202540 RepID=J3TWN3_CARRU|nr:hypothetical protein [Candidatus Carsonella ruddii]AFP84360.1 putative ribosomal protein L21 [Candidatus Carsonella ruddii PC isolate NHV]
MIKKKDINIVILIGNKYYLSKINNYLIVDYINFFPGKNIIFNNIKLLNKNLFYNINYDLKLNTILLKHFFIKKVSFKKKRRKNFQKKIFNYNKKSILFLQNIF